MNHGRNIAQFEKAKTAKKSKYINESRSGSSRRWWSDSYRIRRAKKKKSPKMKKSSAKIRELDSDNRVVDWDSSDASDTDEYSPFSAVLSFVGVLRPTGNRFNLFSSVCVIFRLVHFTRPASLKKIRATEKSSLRLERIAKHKRSFSKRSRVKIICLRVVNFPCTDWLS